ncbi:MAG: hypothetical protein PHI48_13855 [Bacteroidales bacterium]|nr:hypothetical protein [Bacteroidales bacterium]MDD4823627.1 hypothetical protein [Bacteroidales bacterium]
MKKDQAKKERGDELLHQKLCPFFSKYIKQVDMNPEELERISPLSAGTYQKLITGENVELYSMTQGANILFYIKGYQFEIDNQFKTLQRAGDGNIHVVLRETPARKLYNYDESKHLYIPVTESKVSPLYPCTGLSEAKRTIIKKYSTKVVAASMAKNVGPFAEKCHKKARKNVIQLEEIYGHNHTTITNLHHGRNIQMNKYLYIFDTYYHLMGWELSYPNLTRAILRATKNGNCLVMDEVYEDDLYKYSATDFLYSYRR